MRGKFLVIEGLDGAGTTSQVMRLQKWLATLGIRAEVEREPTAGPIGSLIRQAIDARLKFDPAALALLFAADRVDHLQNPQRGILQTLDSGRWVICDRYVLSSLAYQPSDGLDPEWIAAINRHAVAPDLTLFIDTPVSECMKRINNRSSHVELFHEQQKLERVHAAYLKALAGGQFIGQLALLDGTASEENVFAALKNEIQKAGLVKTDAVK